MSILIKIAVNAVAVWVATLVVPGVSVSGGDNTHKLLTFLLIGAIFGLVNTLVKPVLVVLGFPFILLTLGLALLIVNAIVLGITEWVSKQLDLNFAIDDFFWSTVGAALVISVVSWLLNVLIPDGD